MSNKFITLAVGLVLAMTAWFLRAVVKDDPQTVTPTPHKQTSTHSFHNCPEPTSTQTEHAPIANKSAKVVVNQTVQAAPNAAKQSIVLKVGDPILAYSVLDTNEKPTRFVPIYNDNEQFGSIAIYKQQNTGAWRMSDIMPLFPVTTEFPAVNISQARKLAHAAAAKQKITANDMGKMVHLNNSNLYHHFQGADGNGEQVMFLVNAYTGDVEQLSAQNIKDEQIYLNMDKAREIDDSGHIQLNQSLFAQLPPKEQQILRVEINFDNDMIRQGKLKLDNYGNIAQDNRTDDDWKIFDDMMAKVNPEYAQALEENAEYENYIE